MDVTILDLMNFKKLDGMKLIAGKNGLNKRVLDCGILDYEFDSNLKDKYLYSNFHEGQFALSTFLYAKDNEHLISEAVKYLVEKKVSGLAIKNIYNLNLHDYILRYAESNDFPIFIIENPYLYFENIIISIDDCIKSMAGIDYGQKEIDAILNKNLDDSAIKTHALQLNPSFLSHYISVYFYFKNCLTINQYETLIAKFKESQFYNPFTSLLRYRNGLIMICSFESLSKNEENNIIESAIQIILDFQKNVSIGTSEIHHRLHEIKQAINECIYAAMLNCDSTSSHLSYRDIGSYQAIFPYASEIHLQLFSKKIMNPIRDFDAENKFILTQTLIKFIKCEGVLSDLAHQLNLHENTVRYRLEKIETITGLNYRKPEHYHQLSLAVKIYICNELSNSF